MLIRPLVAALLSLAAALASAHSENESAKYAPIDCDHPAPGVATALPEALADPAHLQCTPAFQQIVSSEAWSWRYPGSFFERPFIPAYAPTPSHGMGGARYFTAFQAVELTEGEVATQHERFKAIPTYREGAAPVRILKLVATNDLGHELDAFFGFRSEREGWVVMCAPECAPENMFLIEKR